MKTIINELLPILPHLERLMALVIIFVCRKEIISFTRDMLSEGNPLSSKRGIAFACSWTLFYLCIEYYNTNPNKWVLVILLVLIIFCMGFATFPQILDAIVQLKSFVIAKVSSVPIEQSQPAQVNVTTNIDTANKQEPAKPADQ